jgi:hypothetical protein
MKNILSSQIEKIYSLTFDHQTLLFQISNFSKSHEYLINSVSSSHNPIISLQQNLFILNKKYSKLSKLYESFQHQEKFHQKYLKESSECDKKLQDNSNCSSYSNSDFNKNLENQLLYLNDNISLMNSQMEQFTLKLKSKEVQNQIFETQLINLTNENNHLKSELASRNSKAEIEIQNLQGQLIVQTPNLENQLKETLIQVDSSIEENQISIQI